MALTNISIIPTAYALNTLTQTSDTDFGAGTKSNIVIDGKGENAKLRLALFDSWTNKAPATKPSGRCRHSMAPIYNDDKVVLFGGYDGANYFDDTWVYDYSDNNWTIKAPATKPSARCGHGMAPIYNDDKVVLFGGYDSANYFDDTWVYDYSDNNWAIKAPTTKPTARRGFAMASIYNDDKVVFFGGGLAGTSYDETWVYDLSDNTWTDEVPDTKPSARCWHSMAGIYNDDKILLFGGVVSGSTNDETWIYDLSDNTWTNKAPTKKPSARDYAAMTGIYNDDKVLLFGGLTTFYDDETWVYDLSTNTWTNKAPATKPSGRCRHSMAPIYNDDKILLFGGDYGAYDDETWVYDPKEYASSGTFISSVIQGNGPATCWKNIKWNPTIQPAGTELKFQLATNNDSKTFNFVGPDGKSNTYYSVSNSSIWSGHNNNRYLKYKAYFSTSLPSTSTPQLDDITITFNTLPDPPTLAGPTDDAWTNNNKPKFSWIFNDVDSGSSQVGFTVEIDNDSNFGSVNYTSNDISSSTTSWSPSIPIVDGIWYWRVRTKDNDGDWGEYSNNWSLKIDTTQPKNLSLQINNGTNVTNTKVVSLTISASDEGSGVEQMCFSNDGIIYTTWETFSKSKSWELTSGIGKKTVYFKVRDKAWNEAVPVSASITYDPTANDTTPPEIINIKPEDGSIIDMQKPTINASYSDAKTGNSGIDTSSVVLKVDGNDVTANATISSTGITYTPLYPLSEGIHTVYLEVRDNSMNRNRATKSWSFTIYITPVLDYITVSPQSITMQIGETKQFNAIGYDKKGREISGLTFKWNVTGGIGNIDNNGFFKAVSLGNGLVIASSQQKIGSASVIVVEKDTDVPKAIIDTVSPNPAKEEQ
ncbi:MAG: kelch repeat-containing protein, partial [Candidatus Thermoplasmatota archaeon]